MRTWAGARKESNTITEDDVRDALTRLDPLWDELFPAEQARIVQLLVERIDVDVDGLSIRLRAQGLESVATELRARAENSTSLERAA